MATAAPGKFPTLQTTHSSLTITQLLRSPYISRQVLPRAQFEWYILQQRAIGTGRHSCAGNDYRDCQLVSWGKFTLVADEPGHCGRLCIGKHKDWERIVKSSFNSGLKRVRDLYEMLFATEDYPDKSENGWCSG